MKTLEIINAIPHPIALLDPHLRVSFMNNKLEALTGHASEAVKGISAEHVIRFNFGVGDIRSALKEGLSFSGEGDIIDADRKKIAVRLTATLLKGDNDRCDGIMMALEDISRLHELDKKVHLRGSPELIIGHSPKMEEIYELLPVLACTDATVLITGETGTGKDLLAEAIHKASRRADHPFVKVNSGAIPEALLESELFGHKRGAYTGAHSDKPGMFRLAQGGTIFLTEIGDLPLQLQVKLLTVLDDREFYPLGSTKKVSVDVRVITGTHCDLKQLVRAGKFREDLYFRLNVLRAHLPPLRERGNDVLLLLDHFLKKICDNTGRSSMGFTEAAYARLASYRYPGNVRELRNIVEYAASMCKDDRIDLRHLPPSVLTLEEEAPLDLAPPASSANRQAFPDEGKTPPSLVESGSSWTEIEKKKILAALVHNNGSRTQASRELGWGRSTLWRKMKQYGIG